MIPNINNCFPASGSTKCASQAILCNPYSAGLTSQINCSNADNSSPDAFDLSGVGFWPYVLFLDQFPYFVPSDIGFFLLLQLGVSVQDTGLPSTSLLKGRSFKNGLYYAFTPECIGVGYQKMKNVRWLYSVYPQSFTRNDLMYNNKQSFQMRFKCCSMKWGCFEDPLKLPLSSVWFYVRHLWMVLVRKSRTVSCAIEKFLKMLGYVITLNLLDNVCQHQTTF